MKRALFLLFIFFCISITTPAYASRYFAEAKIGYFRPFSDTLRDIYSDGWANYELEISYTPFCVCDPCWWTNFYAWGGYNYLYDKGETRSGVNDDVTDIQIYSFSLGLKYFQPMPCCTELYAGAGLRYFILRIDNRDNTVDRRERANGLGGVFSLGFIVRPYRCFTMDFFTDLAVKHFDESEFTKQNNEVEKSIDVTGITFGVGVGIVF